MNTMKVMHPLGMFCLLLLLASVLLAEEPLPPPTDAGPPAVAVIPSDGFNLAVEDIVSPERIVANLVNPVHNFFAGRFTHLPTDCEFMLGISMAGNDTKGNKADVTKWHNLKPVFSYADPTQYASYEWFVKDEQGRWVSGDICKTGDARFTGTGRVPDQHVIPTEIAPTFLSADNKYWSPWREIENVEVLAGLNVIRIKQKFDLPTATVALRVPFTYTYEQALIEKLQAANPKFPGVSIDEIGTTPEKRKLQVIRLDDPAQVTPLRIAGFVKKWWVKGLVPDIRIEDTADTKVSDTHRVILVVAREHANEQASSWTVAGVLRVLLEDTPAAAKLRKDTTWLLVPIEDPDGSAHALFDPLTGHFWFHEGDATYGDYTPVEAVAYAAYLRAFVNSGRAIDAAVSYHNLECNEGPSILSPFAIVEEKDITITFNQFWFDQLGKQNIPTGAATPWDVGRMDHRLYGFCGRAYGALPLAFEVNDRYPQRRLALNELEAIGQSFAQAITIFLDSEQGRARMQRTRAFLAKRQQDMEQYWKTSAWPKDNPSVFDMLSKGY